tara:strand:- start:436 stop:1335 length:900 start_codon:yes stop_codon:yes gene_type:complete
MYFDKFPVLRYLDSFDADTRIRLVTDVLRRVAAKNISEEQSSFFIKYDTQDGDTPENISHRLYDTVDYFWVVLLLNEALNPYYDMALDTISLENFVKNKYFGKYFYLVDYDNNVLPTGITFSADETLFRTSTTGITDDFGTIQHEFKVRARVVEHDPSLSRIRVDGGEHVQFSEGEVIGVLREESLQRAKIKKIEDGIFGLNKFQKSDGTVVNPLASSSDDETPLGVTGSSGEYTSVAPEFYQTRLGVYLGVSGDSNTTHAINNYEHEETENETKRSIKLIHPDQLQNVVSAFEKLITG